MTKIKVSGTILLSCFVLFSANAPVLAAATVQHNAQKTHKAVPSNTASSTSSNSSGANLNPGTLLLPLTPKIDNSVGLEPGESVRQELIPVGPNSKTPMLSEEIDIEEQEGAKDELSISSEINEDTTLKGTVQLIADDTEFDQEKNTFLGTGNAVCIIAGQDSKLEADMILYDQNTDMIDARGNVRIYRDGQVTTGSAFKFDVNKEEYLITSPDTAINGTTIVAKRMLGANDGLRFSKGNMTMSKPFYYARQQNIVGMPGVFDDMWKIKAHPEAYLPAKPSFKFKADKMVYEKYKEEGNLTVFGGRMMFGKKDKFGIPLGKFTATVDKESNNVVFPVTPSLGNNLQIGGVHLGPSFNKIVDKGVLSWSPMLQFGGRTLDGSSSSSGIGLSGRASYTSKKLMANVAAGSVNNLLVADLHYKINDHMKFQSGINRYLDDGMFGFRRARLAAEVVDGHIYQNVPFMTSVTWRNSAGWFQDNPQLVNQSADYAKLFGGTQTSKVMPSGFKLQTQMQFATKPVFAIGDDKYGMRGFLYGGVAARAYSSGDASLIGQLGPVLDVRLNRLRLQANYNQSAVRGDSPFVFDQFIQGNRSMNLMGDLKVHKYLTIGAGAGYNLTNSLFFSRTVSAAIGPEDFKVILSREMVRGINRVGFNVMYGSAIPFNKLVLKGNPDHGQLGGI